MAREELRPEENLAAPVFGPVVWLNDQHTAAAFDVGAEEPNLYRYEHQQPALYVRFQDAEKLTHRDNDDFSAKLIKEDEAVSELVDFAGRFESHSLGIKVVRACILKPEGLRFWIALGDSAQNLEYVQPELEIALALAQPAIFHGFRSSKKRYKIPVSKSRKSVASEIGTKRNVVRSSKSVPKTDFQLPVAQTLPRTMIDPNTTSADSEADFLSPVDELAAKELAIKQGTGCY